jgi:hypothetical protein
MQMPKEHILHGLEPDNLLAFLALLGFHRAVDRAKPDWRGRVYWTGVPLRPRLLLHQHTELEELLEAAATGCAELAEVHSFGGIKRMKEIDSSLAKQMLRNASLGDRTRADLISALMSEIAFRDDGELQRTPFYAVSGQQGFFDRLENVPKGNPSKSGPGSAYLNSPARLGEAVFTAWNRKDSTDGFRWDPLEDRRYALRFNDPSPEGAGATVHGANRLAALAIPLLTAVPRRQRGEVRLLAVGVEARRGGPLTVRWPIWSRPASLRAITFMLAGCGVAGPYRGLGIITTYVSSRISVEKYFNFTRAVNER